MHKVGTFERLIALFIEKRLRPPKRHSRESGNLEAPQKPSASVRQHGGAPVNLDAQLFPLIKIVGAALKDWADMLRQKRLRLLLGASDIRIRVQRRL